MTLNDRDQFSGTSPISLNDRDQFSGTSPISLCYPAWRTNSGPSPFFAWLIGAFIPALPTRTAWDFALLAEIAAVLIGLAAGVLPALRAAALDPVAALHEE
jgi:ABC-type lipoprotein release transport system permease subunit